jgi:hypothetical protein
VGRAPILGTLCDNFVCVFGVSVHTLVLLGSLSTNTGRRQSLTKTLHPLFNDLELEHSAAKRRSVFSRQRSTLTLTPPDTLDLESTVGTLD